MRESLTLTGKLVQLRHFTAEDITDRYVGWLNDAAVTRFSNQRFRQHDITSCRAYLASFQGTDNLFLSMRRLADEEPIGTMTVYVSPHHGTADVGILVGEPSVWGKGFGQDAWNTVLAWLEARPDIRKITAGTVSPNVGMRRLLERSGMMLEGRRINQEIIEGEPQDVLYYARFRLR